MHDSTTIKKSLLCVLTDDERRTYGIKLATSLEDIETVQADKKRQTDHFKDRIAGLQANADQLRRNVSTGQEWRDLECTVIFGQPTPNQKQTIRPDTGEVVETTWITESEKQRELPLLVENVDGCECDSDDDVIDVESEPVEQEAAKIVGEAPPDDRVPPSTGFKTKKENASFDAGFRAYSRDKDLATENPYDPADLKKTAVSFAWADGWDNAALLMALGKSWLDEPLPTDDDEAPQPADIAEDF